jgi:predicted dehydrogenase
MGTMADEQPVGAVVVGTGFGVLTHVRALQAAGFRVDALVGRDPSKAATRAAMFGVPFATTDLAAALDRPGVQAVTVATPPHTHAAVVLQAVAAGKHVMCEKPFARDRGEAQAMLDAADAAGVVHLLGTEFRFATGQALLARTVRSGAVGEPRLGVFVLHIPTLADPSAELPAWWERAEEGGGWLGAYGSHVVDQVRTTLGEVTAVAATLQTLAPRAMTADDTYTVQLQTDGGCTALLHSSCAAGGQFVAVTKVTGTSGTAWAQGDEVWVDTGSGPRQVPSPPDLPVVPPDPPPAELLRTTYDMWHSMGTDQAPYTRLFTEFRARIAGEPPGADPVAATFADGVANQAVLDAVHAASSSGAWAKVGG